MVTRFSVLAGRIRGQRSLVGYSPWGNKESDMTERLIHISKAAHNIKAVPSSVKSESESRSVVSDSLHPMDAWTI